MRGERYENTQAAVTLVAAVVGAGFASGREVMRFFSIFGAWSWAGCALAAFLLAAISAWAAILARRLGAHDLVTLCRRALGNRGGNIAAWVHGALIVITAGAMIAAMGELAALSLPIYPAYQVGVVFAVVVGVFFAGRGVRSIAAIGWWLLPTCLLLYVLLIVQPPSESAYAWTWTPPRPWHALPLAFAYASMNAALGSGVLCELGEGQSDRGTLRACALAGLLLFLLLLGANAALVRYAGELGDAAMPIVMLARPLGAVGYWLCIAVLSLAVMTTLVAMLRTLRRMLGAVLPAPISVPLSLALPVLAGLVGYNSLIGSAYPLLGFTSTLLFLAILLKPLKVRSQLANKRALYLPPMKKMKGSKQDESTEGGSQVPT